MQFFLSIFEAHRQIRRPFRAPKEIEVIAKTLKLIEQGHGTEEPVLPLECD